MSSSSHVDVWTRLVRTSSITAVQASHRPRGSCRIRLQLASIRSLTADTPLLTIGAKWYFTCAQYRTKQVCSYNDTRLPSYLRPTTLRVVTSGHVTKMAVTPFDPPLSKTACYMQTSWLYVLQNRSYGRSKFYIAE